MFGSVTTSQTLYFNKKDLRSRGREKTSSGGEEPRLVHQIGRGGGSRNLQFLSPFKGKRGRNLKEKKGESRSPENRIP